MGNRDNNGDPEDKKKQAQDLQNDLPINYDPADRDNAERYLGSKYKFKAPENGEYIITYSFESFDYHGNDGIWESTFPSNLMEDQKKLQEQAFAEYEKYSPVHFVRYDVDGKFEEYSQKRDEYRDRLEKERSDLDQWDEAKKLALEDIGIADIVVAKTHKIKDAAGTIPDYVLAVSNFPDDDPQQCLIYTYNSLNKYNDEQYYKIVLHETGHLFGLFHPQHGDHVAGQEQSALHIRTDFTDGTYRTVSPTVMIDNLHGQRTSNAQYLIHDIPPSTLMPWDIAALQDKYGKNTKHNAGNTIHKLGQEPLQTIWDGSGNQDVLSAKGDNRGAVINLWESMDYPSSIGLSITYLAYGSNIENAVGSLEKDRLTGNNMDNRLDGDQGDDILRGNAGNDTYVGGQGDDKFDLRSSDITGESVLMGHDVIEYFKTHVFDEIDSWVSWFGSPEEDVLLVDENVYGATMYEDGNDIIILFQDKDGNTIPDSSVTLKDFDGWTIDIDIHRINADGSITEFDSDQITRTGKAPPKDYKLGATGVPNTEMKRSLIENNGTSLCDVSQRSRIKNDSQQTNTLKNVIKPT